MEVKNLVAISSQKRKKDNIFQIILIKPYIYYKKKKRDREEKEYIIYFKCWHWTENQ